MRMNLGDKYVDKIVKEFPIIKDSVDFCSYWFYKAHNQIGNNGRAGLVGTNTVSQGLTRRASLEYIVENGGYIHEAVSTQPWSGEAKVHVSIINWSKKIPELCYLDNQNVSSINSSLTSEISVAKAYKISKNSELSFIGVQPTGIGFIVSNEQVVSWIKLDNKNKDVLKLFSMGGNLVDNPNGEPDRWIIDFDSLSLEDSQEYSVPFDHIKKFVKPDRDGNRDPHARNHWWRFLRHRPKMRVAISSLSCYFVVPRVSKWATFIPASIEWLPGDLNVVVPSDDFYVLGVLTSNVHRTWVKAQSSTLEDRTRYTPSTCFETFPFPQTPTQKQIDAIRKTAVDLHEYRSVQMEKKQWGITKLYNEYFNEPASQLAKLHKMLDDLVLKAYGFSKTDDLLEKLLALNLEVAEKEKNGESAIGPWAPDDPPKK